MFPLIHLQVVQKPAKDTEKIPYTYTNCLHGPTRKELIEDYDRLKFASKEMQLLHFPPLLDLAKEFNLPLFLHSRAPDAHVDFVRILKDAGWSDEWAGGVVHSFTGTKEEMEELVSPLAALPVVVAPAEADHSSHDSICGPT